MSGVGTHRLCQKFFSKKFDFSINFQYNIYIKVEREINLIYGSVAQLGVRVTVYHEVVGSCPIGVAIVFRMDAIEKHPLKSNRRVGVLLVCQTALVPSVETHLEKNGSEFRLFPPLERQSRMARKPQASLCQAIWPVSGGSTHQLWRIQQYLQSAENFGHN